MELLIYVRNNIENPEERKKIVYKIDAFLTNSYWKQYMKDISKEKNDETKT
jgi:hypothetical protein